MCTTTTPKIQQPKLIIYRSARHQRSSQNNLKYRFFSNNIDDFHGLNRHQYRIPMKRHISNISYKLSVSLFSNNNFLKFLTKTRSITRLTLEFFNDKRVGRMSESLFHKRIRKIFILCSKLQRINLRISHDYFAPCVTFPFKYLALAKSLKYFNCSLGNIYLIHFQALVDYIVSSHRKGLKQANSFRFGTIDFLDEINLNNQNRSKFNEIQKIIGKLSQIHQNLSLNYNLVLDGRLNFEETLDISQMVFPLPILHELTIGPELDSHLVELLKTTPKNRLLTKLVVGLVPFKSSDTLPVLSQFIRKARDLTSLKVAFKDFTQGGSLDSFIEKLKGCLNLSSLSLNFSRCACVDRSLLATLMQTLQSLPKLTHLSLHYRSSPSSFKELVVKDLFAEIKTLSHLLTLELDLDGPKSQVSNHDFTLLCESLASLDQLQILRISLPYVNLEDTGVTSLSTIIPGLRALHTLSLNLDGMRALSEKSLKELTKSLAALRYLSKLTLAVGCSKMSFEGVKGVISDFWRMKCLNRFTLGLDTSNWDSEVQTYFLNSIQQLQRKLK